MLQGGLIATKRPGSPAPENDAMKSFDGDHSESGASLSFALCLRHGVVLPIDDRTAAGARGLMVVLSFPIRFPISFTGSSK